MPIANRLISVAVLFVCGLVLACPTHAEEPYERFLQKLQDEGLYDLAILYVDDLLAQPGLSRKVKGDLEVEQGILLYQSASLLPPSNPSRDSRLDAAEKQLRDFLSTKPNHPRRGDVRLKLGELLLVRADEAQKDKDAGEENAEAIKFYDDAHQLFESTIKELAGILEQIKGARTDPNDKAKVAYRQRVQQSLRQAQLLSAKSVDDRGQNRKDGSAGQRKDYDQALKMFGDLYQKEQRMIGVRNYALFYRSSLQSRMDKKDDAIDGFQRIADLQGVDLLRPLQTNAVAELVKLFAEEGKYPLAVDRADRWIANLRPHERTIVETIDLQLELAKAKLAWSAVLEEKDPGDRVAGRLKRDSRDALRTLLRTPGDHLEEARKLLSELGVAADTKASEELPQVTSFAEALAEAQQRIDRSETDTIQLAILMEQGQQDSAKKIQQSVDTAQQQALVLLREALRLYAPDDDRNQLFDAQYKYAFLLLKQQRPWEAMAIARFLAEGNPNTDKGLRAAAVTLTGFSDLLRTAGEEEKAGLTRELEPFAVYLVETWSDSAEAAAAAAALVQLAVINKQWDKVDQYLGLLPDSGESVRSLRQDVGLTFYAKYFEEQKAANGENDDTQALRAQALATLTKGVEGVAKDDVDARVIECINAIARLLLIDGRAKEAKDWLGKGATAPLKILETQPDAAPALIAMSSYRTAIQIVNWELLEGKTKPDTAVQRISSYVDKLQALADKTDDGARTLASIFVGLARDTKQQIDAAPSDAVRLRLAQTLVIVAAQAGRSEAFTTKYWAADTIITMADQLASQPSAKSQAEKAYSDAASLLETILAKEESQPGWIDPPALITKIRLRLAMSKRGLGDYKSALNSLGDILSENSGLLEVQMEAARTYQAWAEEVNSVLHKAAYAGGRPDKQTGEKLFWGWGKIGQMVANNPNYTEYFFQARYELARSRFLYAQGLANADQKKAETARSEKDVTSTAKLYPTLGGTAMKKKFESLLMRIQKAQGKPATGFAAG